MLRLAHLQCSEWCGVGRRLCVCAWKLFSTLDKPNHSIHVFPFLWHCTSFPSSYFYCIREMCKIKKESSKLPSNVFAFIDFSQNNLVSSGDGPLALSHNWAPLYAHPPHPGCKQAGHSDGNKNAFPFFTCSHTQSVMLCH